jgi:hypothetical protein
LPRSAAAAGRVEVSGLVCQVTPDSPQTTTDEVVQLAVRIAKTLQNAAIKSMHEKDTPP